jgi:hypothetical protein
MKRFLAAPKLDTVNQQIRGDGERNAQVADMSLSNALSMSFLNLL